MKRTLIALAMVSSTMAGEPYYLTPIGDQTLEERIETLEINEATRRQWEQQTATGYVAPTPVHYIVPITIEDIRKKDPWLNIRGPLSK